MREVFGAFARSVNVFTASPQATGLAFIIVLLWGAAGPFFHYSDGWQLFINTGTTIVTFLMIFVLNNAQSRDTAAMNSKLDALIVAITAADNRLVGLERKPEKQTVEIIKAIETAVSDADRG